MKNLCIIGALLMATLLGSCDKEAFKYEPYIPKVAEIDSVYFSVGGTSLIADGQASLQFVVETFRKTQVTDENGLKKDTLVFTDYRNLPEGSLKIFKGAGEEVGMTYSTTDLSAGSLDFYAQIGDVRSKTKTVVLRPKQVLPPAMTVDVIFHVFEMNSTDPGYDELTYQPITQAHLEEGIAYANTVFNNVLGNDPNGGKMNIEFRLATKDPNGNTLPKPGYRLITYDKTWKPETRAYWSSGDFTDGIKGVNKTPSYAWDPERYLNIYIIPVAASSATGDNKPKYQMVQTGETPIQGLANPVTAINVVTSKDDLPKDKFYETYGLGVPRTLFFPGTDRKIELATFLGTYYGLLRTAIGSLTETDFCNDTRKYLSNASNPSVNLVKNGIDGIKFIANNAMDDNRYPSLRNCFTLDQINRMRAVMEHCPNRFHYTIE